MNRKRPITMPMIRTRLTLAIVCGLCAAAVQSHAAAADAAERKPNIVLILSDDMGYADIGAHGCRASRETCGVEETL